MPKPLAESGTPTSKWKRQREIRKISAEFSDRQWHLFDTVTEKQGTALVNLDLDKATGKKQQRASNLRRSQELDPMPVGLCLTVA